VKTIDSDYIKYILALIAIKKAAPIGRYTLKNVLDLSEGKTRGLLKKLSNNNTIVESKAGASLTDQGIKELEKLCKKHKIKRIVERINVEELGISEESIALNLEDGKIINHSITLIRDIAIKFGANTAIIILYKDGKFIVPAVFENLCLIHPKFCEILAKEFTLNPGDVIVICSADNIWRALEGALAIAIYLTMSN